MYRVPRTERRSRLGTATRESKRVFTLVLAGRRYSNSSRGIERIVDAVLPSSSFFTSAEYTVLTKLRVCELELFRSD